MQKGNCCFFSLLNNLFRWGHTSHSLEKEKKIILFGGYGGAGSHSRLNDILLFDTITMEVNFV